MLEQLIVDHLKDIDHKWAVVGVDGQKRLINPTDEEVEKVLDEAAKNLYNENIGSRFEVGGLIIEKLPVGFAVYAYFGHYI